MVNTPADMRILERVVFVHAAPESENNNDEQRLFTEEKEKELSSCNANKKRKAMLPMIRKTKLLMCCLCLVFVFGFYHLTTSRFPLKHYFSASSWSNEACTPQNSIVFLKTHKTAGSTVQNIFMRYADSHGLLVALPVPDNYLGHPVPFRRSFVPPLKPGYSYDILCHHARFNYPELAGVIGENATFITIIRDPPYMFESLFSYYKLQKYFNASLEDFALSTRSVHLMLDSRVNYKFGRNQMSFDLGLTETLFDDQEAVMRYVSYLDSTFHLVMIAERMKESLVLLRHLLCWQPEDILMFEHNVRLPINKKSFDPLVEDGLRELNSADQMLYEYFDQRLSERIAEFGVERMKREVLQLERDLERWYQLCIETRVTSKQLTVKYKPYSNQVYGFKLRRNVTNPICEKMAKAELPYTAELRQRQIPFYQRRSARGRHTSSGEDNYDWTYV